jgi:hypothetical protein
MRSVEHRRRQIEELTSGACDAYRRVDLTSLGRFLEVMARIQER